MHRYPLLLIILLTLMACERELNIDYHTVEPLYVAEMELTDHNTTARITTTRPVTETAASDYLVNDAIITIRSTQDSWADTLKWKSQGRYELSYFFGMEGMEYEADVIIGGKHHLSTSVMKGKPVINSFDFVWMDMMSEKILFADLHLQDVPDQNNFYFMHLYRNDVGYRWAIMDDRSNPGGELQQLFTCTTQREMDKGTDSDVLHEGDKMRMEVRSIDRRTYDYLYSLQLMDNTGTNPLANFSGGLLGFFSAYQQATEELVFRLHDIR